MPDNKSHHFVPRCHFKPFSKSEEGKAINLYTTEKQILISNAPVRSQCASDYFYGADGQLELELSRVEGDYASAVRRVVAKENTDQDANLLRFVSYVQLRRTETAMMRIKEAEEAILQDVPEHIMPPPVLGDIMSTSMTACMEAQPLLSDLKVRIIANETNLEFVTSDNPAIATNKWMIQKMNAEGFGVMSSGFMLFMPLTPRSAVLSFDGGVYTTPSLERGRLTVKKDSDVEAINELQYLNCAKNIYFSSWSMRDHVSELFNSAKTRRIKDWFVTRYYLSVISAEGSEVFREVTEEEARAPNSKCIVHSGVRYPIPSKWLSALKYRDPIKTFSDGTGVGHVRKEEWLHA